MINTKTKTLVLLMFAVYIASFFLWSIPYYLIVRQAQLFSLFFMEFVW